MKIVAVTGTDGKTTTCWLIKQALEAAGKKVGMLGSVKYCLGTEEVPAGLTTPSRVDTVKYLAKMVEAGCDYAVLEASSHGLDQGRLLDADVDVAVFTNLTAEHLDYHKTMQGYLEAKAKLFQPLRSDAVAVLNADDLSSEFFEKSTLAKVVKYSRHDCLVGQMSLKGMGVGFMDRRGRQFFETPLVGLHNAENMMAALTAVRALGIEDHWTYKAFEEFECVPGRLEWVTHNVCVDYAHTPNAVRRVLSLLRTFCRGRLIHVFGCNGERDWMKRPVIGRLSEALADDVFLTDDKPRNEDPVAIIDEIRRGMRSPGGARVIRDRRLALAAALEMTGPDDIMVVTNRGHETGEEVGGEKIPMPCDVDLLAGLVEQPV